MHLVHLVYLVCISTAQSHSWYATVGFGFGSGGERGSRVLHLLVRVQR